ncbi:hypothetical protein K1719_034668 [Acacia pycnantha]|nr:hypothetical protein K1719_034668 [Acacia pycnantha]
MVGTRLRLRKWNKLASVFSSGSPDPNAVIYRYLSSATSSSYSLSDPTPVHDLERESASLRREFEEAMKLLEEEKKFVNADTGGLGCGGEEEEHLADRFIVASGDQDGGEEEHLDDQFTVAAGDHGGGEEEHLAHPFIVTAVGDHDVREEVHLAD